MHHLLRRIGFYLVALWASITLNFLIPRLVPGNPAQVLIARLQGRIDPRAERAMEVAFGISHASLWRQYVEYLGNLAHGNLGISVTYFPTPVATVIGQRLDALLPPALTFLSAIPYFWLALILLYILGFVLNWFPLSGGYDLSTQPGWSPDFLLSAAQHALLPAFTIVVSSIAGWLLGMRNAMMTTLNEDYVLMAQAKGLSERRVMLAYAARNAILPNITGFALSLGFVVGGALLTEIVFSYPGIGFALLQAVQNSDYALLQGIFLIIAVAVLGANFLADLIYVALDPRVRQERS